jgi:hypothetical protein
LTSFFLSLEEKLQLYHDYMLMLLCDFKSICAAKPVMWVNLGCVWERRQLHIKLCLVSGNQKSQDYICGRMSINSGNAGHIHHGCMASAIHLSSAVSPDGYLLSQPCCEPPAHVMSRLYDLALIDLGNEAQDGPMWVVKSCFHLCQTQGK